MSVLSAVSVADIKARGSINNVDVLKLRRNYYDDGRITADDAEIICALNDACPVQDPAWADWFVETLTDFVVDQVKPEGYLTSDNAAWLIAHIAKNGRIETGAAMNLVLGVLDRARWVPPSLVCFALDQVLRSGKQCVPRTIGEAHVDLFRRVMCAFDGDGHLPVTQPEAEILFDIDATTARRENHPSWGDLFVKAIANCVLAASGYATPPRKLALARDPWLARRSHFTLDRRAACAGFGYKSTFGSYRFQSTEERDIARLTRQKLDIVTNEPLAMAKASWLACRIACDGCLSPNARALLVLFGAESPILHPSLQALVDKAAAAS